jgi:hypothetical protein
VGDELAIGRGKFEAFKAEEDARTGGGVERFADI